MRRGDVYWARFPSPVGRRPVVLVSRDEAYSVRARVSVVPLTRTVRGMATEVRFGPSDGLPRACVANADEVVTIPKSLLGERLVSASRARMKELDDALRFALALDKSA
jgi:mRNA interferase MazF